MLKVGVLCGDRWHPAEVIRQGLEPLQKNGTTLEFLSDIRELPRERLKEFGVLVLCKANEKVPDEDRGWLREEVQQNFRDFTTQGGGLFVCHSGTVGYREEPDFRALVGGVFIHHPKACPVTIEYITDFGHAVDDPKSFQVHDEHYFMETGDDIEVFLTSTSENGSQPAGWTRQEGDGRVCVLTPGHFTEVWTHPVYQHTLQKALDWCAKAEGTL